MKLKDKELWLELYDIAKEIQKLEPWKYLWDTDLLVYLSEPLKDILYCSVMGHAGMHTAIGVYQGNQINKFMDIAKNQYPENLFINYQDCLMCNFSSRQDTLPKNREIIKELGISFRGTWISFENFEKGYEPSPINIKQVKIMIEALKNFCMMFRAIIEQGMIANFDEGEVLVRHYDKERKLYLNYASPLMIPEKDYQIIHADDNFKKDIMKIPQTEMEIEYEFLNYLPFRMRDFKEQDGRYYYPRVRAISDKQSGIMLLFEFINKNDYKSEEEYLLESVKILIDYFHKIGRPKKIYVRDEETKMYLKEIADKAKIKLVVKSRLKSIDEFYESMEEEM